MVPKGTCPPAWAVFDDIEQVNDMTDKSAYP